LFGALNGMRKCWESKQKNIGKEVILKVSIKMLKMSGVNLEINPSSKLGVKYRLIEKIGRY